jgi:hypothetical protein
MLGLPSEFLVRDTFFGSDEALAITRTTNEATRIGSSLKRRGATGYNESSLSFGTG